MDNIEITSPSEYARGRHRTFIKYGIPVEVHAFFASMNDSDKAQAFDDMIIQIINSSHIPRIFIMGWFLLNI